MFFHLSGRAFGREKIWQAGTQSNYDLIRGVQFPLVTASRYVAAKQPSRAKSETTGGLIFSTACNHNPVLVPKYRRSELR